MTDTTVQNTPQDAQEDAQDAVELTTDPEAVEDPQDAQEGTQEADTFPRSYVEKLRDENARYRQRAQRADDLATRLHTALVAATGRLADPGDLDFDEDHLDDPGALDTALDDLLTRKPHLASRRPRGDVGQGVSVSNATVDLAGILRSRA